MRLTLPIVILLAALLAGCDGNSSEGDQSSSGARVIYFVRLPAKPSGEPSFELRSARPGDQDSRLVVSLPAIRDDLAVSTEGDKVALPTDYTDHPELLLIELSSGTVTPLIDSTGGNGVVELGPNGAIALCRENGDFLAGSINEIDELTELVPGTGPAAGCPNAAWSVDGGLVFVAPMPLAAFESGDDYGFYVLSSALEQLKVIRVPESNQPRSRQSGPGDITLSADGRKLAYIAGPFGEQALHILDIESGVTSSAGRAYAALFSPSEADLIAVWDRDEHNLVVRNAGEELGRLKREDDFVFAWCPDSSWIAIANSGSVSLWNWQSGELTRVARSRFPDGPLLGGDVACVKA